MSTTSCIPSHIIDPVQASGSSWSATESYTVTRHGSNGSCRRTSKAASSRRHRNPRLAAVREQEQRNRLEPMMSSCCISFPSSTFSSQNDRLMRKDAIVGKKVYVTRSVLSVTTSPQSTDGSSGGGPSTKASTVVPWPSPSTDADSVVEAPSSQNRSPGDGVACLEVPGDALDRTDLSYFLPALTRVLDHLIYIGEEKERTMSNRPLRSRYHSVTVPNISVSDYLSRLARFFNCSGECFVIALIYLDRAVKESAYVDDESLASDIERADNFNKKPQQSFNITRLNIHRLLLTALTLAAKYYDDCYYANKRYAEVGGVSTRELNSLEASFLDMIHYRLYVAPEEYSAYKEQVENVLNPPVPTAYSSSSSSV